jgi:thiosulfate/3-mercaptopyruvate sulfurtransferase
MGHATLVSPEILAGRLHDPGWIVFDCRHDLAQPGAGEREFSLAHIPGARFMHLDRDLAGPLTGSNGRHPLPEPQALADKLSRSGVGPSAQVVAYDTQGGMFAARLWWLLRWLGHDDVAVLDGGWPRWVAEGWPTSTAVPVPSPARFVARPGARWIGVDELWRTGDSSRLVDGRAPDRFRGENETLDPVAGRIPGARNRFFRDNLDASGCFKSPDALRHELGAALAGAPPEQAVHYCGSGVTACHNLLAMEIAGLRGSRLYPGSWSEWCADGSRPVARGEFRAGEGIRGR